MSIDITIQGQVITFPSSGASPNWAPAIIQFAQAVEAALAGVAGSFDVAPQALTIDAYNPGTNIDISSLQFPTSDVRAAIIPYAVHRTTDTPTEVDEAGQIMIVYNASNTVGNKWEIAQLKTGDAQIAFNITDTGQVQFSTTAISGSNHQGTITFSARSILQE